MDCVIPTHGRPDYLAEALCSVAAQTAPVARVVVVSDDGDEQSREVVMEFASSSGVDTLFVDRRPGVPGASASRNEGVRRGTAPTLAFLDDDDLWEPGYLAAACARLVETDVDAVATAMRRFSSTGDGGLVIPAPDLTARQVFVRGSGVTGSNLVLRRAVFEAVGGFDCALAVQNDRDLFLRLVMAGARYAVVEAPGVRFRQHADGRLTDASAMRADGVLAFTNKHAKAFSRYDQRVLRYLSHRIRMTSARSPGVLLRSTCGAVANWSPTAGAQLPLGLLDPSRLRNALGRLAG